MIPELGSAVTYPAPPELVHRCTWCTGDIIWINLANGRARSFEAIEIVATTAPARLLNQRGFALRKGGYAVALSNVAAWPVRVLLAHVCDAYLLAREENRLAVGPWGDVLPSLVSELDRERFGNNRDVARERPRRGVQKGRGGHGRPQG